MTTIAVLGGGQLGRMLGLAGIPLGARFRFLDPTPNPPASAIGECIIGALDDPVAIDALITGVDVATYEWEGVPATVAQRIAQRIPVVPSPLALECAQDRLDEKELFAQLEIPTAPYIRVDTRDDLDVALQKVGFPALLKTRTGGYDGKGQALITTPLEADAAWDHINGVPAILEGWVTYAFECSVIAARSRTGEIAIFALPENTHHAGILRTSIAPAPLLKPDVVAQGETFVRRLLEALDYVGVIALECFATDTGLVANEFAPRVHNSGHWTIEGAHTSQFEQHIRAICGLPLGDPSARGVSAMLNCIGALPDPAAALAVPGAHLHEYGKAPRRARKVGHVTVTADDYHELDARRRTLEAILPTDG